MTITLKIAVPNVASLVPTYDSIRVYRSSVSKDGPFTELTASTAQSAFVTGLTAGPYEDLNGKTLILRTENSNGINPDVAVEFSDTNPITTNQAIDEINASGGFFVASNVTDKIKVTSTIAGQTAKITVVGGTALQDLGMSLYQTASGADPFIALVAQQTTYSIVDPEGTSSYWYRWQFYHSANFTATALTTPIHPQDAGIDPNKKVQDFRATKGLTLVRGREHTFRIAFWQDQAANIPLIPDSSGLYPSYSIFDINGELIATGKADLDGSSPNYKAIFLVPHDAVLSTDDRRWRIEWLMVTDTGRQIQSINEFDVRDVDVTESESRDQRYLALENQPYTMRLRLPSEVYSLTFTLTDSDSQDNVLVATTSVVNHVVDGETVVYYYDVPSDLLVSAASGKSYTAIWAIKETPASSTEFNWQIIDVPPFRMLQFFTTLRQVIDKAQMRNGSPYEYYDSDIYTYLRLGLEHVNGIHPANLRYTITSVPSVIEPYWILASSVYGLNAQGLTSVMLGFSFSGQQITLDHDLSAGLDAAANKALQMVNEGVKNIKTHLFRASSGVGAFAGRPMRITGNNNFVYPLYSAGSQSYLSLLQSVGLL